MSEIMDTGFLPIAEQRAIQAARLREHIEYCRERSPYYKSILTTNLTNTQELDNNKNVRDGSCGSWLKNILVTDKSVFAARNAEFLAVPREEIVDIVFSSGTTGDPTPVMYTASDVARLAAQEARAFASCGIGSSDTALLTCTLDRCFVAGFAYCTGLQKLGVAVARNGISPIESHAATMRALSPTVIVGVPVFLRQLGRALDGNADARRVRRLVCIGEPLRDGRMNALPIADDLQRLFPNATVHSTYASSEGVTPFCECGACCGGHVHTDAVVVEIVDADGNPVPDGETGEVVVTPLGVRGMPLLRFRTGDVSFLITEPCRCGRASPRLGPILGRRNQMMKVNGTSLYPAAFFNALDLIPGISQSYVTVTSEDRLSDTVHVTVAVRDASLTAEGISRRLQASLRVKPHVSVETEEAVNAAVFTKASRKPARFVDRRDTGLNGSTAQRPDCFRPAASPPVESLSRCAVAPETPEEATP